MRRFNKLRTPALLLAAASMFLTACAGTNSPTPTIATTTSVCTIWSDISYSASQDSTETVNQIIGNNARRDSYCPKPASDLGCVKGKPC